MVSEPACACTTSTIESSESGGGAVSGDCALCGPSDLPPAGPTLLPMHTTFGGHSLSIVPPRRVRWWVLPGCLGVMEAGPADYADSPSPDWDVLVFADGAGSRQSPRLAAPSWRQPASRAQGCTPWAH